MTNSFSAKSKKNLAVLGILDEIEAEMKRIGFWNTNPPNFSVSNYLEAPSFELWIQCIFLPNARKAAKTGDYPKTSQVGLMAMRQYDYHEVVEEALNLVSLLNRFDELAIKNE
jgi:uncharacterized protein YqcC (DUF446 family)